MEHKHDQRLRSDFPAAVQFKPIYILDIPDEYGLMDSELIALIQAAVDLIVDELHRSTQRR